MLLLAGLLAAVTLQAQDAEDTARTILKQATQNEDDRAQLEQALGRIDTLAAASAPNSIVQYTRGWILSHLGQSDLAVAAYRRAIEIGPPLADTHYNLGVVLSQAQRQAEAVPEFEEALRLDPQNVDAAYNAGQSNYDLGRYGAALAKWRLAQKQTPNDFSVARKILQSLNALGMWEEAAAARDEVRLLLREKRDPTAANVRTFCFDQVPLPSNRIFAYEILDPGSDGIVWSFKITALDQQTVLKEIQLVRETATRHILRVKGKTEPIPPREFTDQPAWRDLRPVVRQWTEQLVAPAAK
jgi:tetratricopeptide (TPR) repeat protein